MLLQLDILYVQMYFIHRGTVEVVSEHDQPIIFDTMGEGRFFGEISVVFSCPRTASIRLEPKLKEGDGFRTRQNLLYVFVRFFGLDPAQNTIVVYSLPRN